jgi:hypothetical protein
MNELKEGIDALKERRNAERERLDERLGKRDHVDQEETFAPHTEEEQKHYYIVKLYDEDCNWHYTDDYHRIVQFDTTEKAEEKVREIFSWGTCRAADIILVTEDAVKHITRNNDNTDSRGKN